MEHHVTMEATKEKMINVISLFGYKKNHLKKLTEKELIDLGIKVGAFEGIEDEKDKCPECGKYADEFHPGTGLCKECERKLEGGFHG